VPFDQPDRPSPVAAQVAARFADKSPLTLLPMPSATLLFPLLGAFTPSAEFVPLPPLECRPDFSTSFILHSSGSTAWPKPIHITQRATLCWLTAPFQSDYRFGPHVIYGSMALPGFHAMGMFAAIIMPLSSGTRAAFFRPAIESEGTGIEAVTVDNNLRAASELGCNVLLLAPSMLTVCCCYCTDLKTLYR
jgi:acyl-CoA synthetase (AMP-forming)/AMP-acid ligase II